MQQPMPHTSVAIMDALEMCKIPIFEVHITNVFRREGFRHEEFVNRVATGMTTGFGSSGYTFSIHRIHELLQK